MKKYIIVISSFFLLLSTASSCSDSELELYPATGDDVVINTKEKLQSILNGAYLNIATAGNYGSEIVKIGELLSDHLFISSTRPSYLTTFNFSYSPNNADINFYGGLYSVITTCNLVINNNKVPESADIIQMKAQAKILRGLAYFTLLQYYAPSPTSGINQEYGVPLVLGEFDPTIEPARATVEECYNQVISDLKYGADTAVDNTSNKVILGKTAAKLLLSRVYLTRRAAGDAQLALQYTTDIINNSPSNVFSPIDATGLTVPANPASVKNYQNYFSATNDDQIDVVYNNKTYKVAGAENQPETVWELDINSNTIGVLGISQNANSSLAGYYDRASSSTRCILFTQAFYNKFSANDVRKGSFTFQNVPANDNPTGVWTTKHLRASSGGTFTRNTKILRFAEVQLNRIEALYLTGNTSEALAKLNEFAVSRGANASYTGANLRDDILAEREKEFFAEGYRFLDLKRYNLPINRVSNCSVTCSVPANDKLFVLPISQASLNNNRNLKQYPGYN